MCGRSCFLLQTADAASATKKNRMLRDQEKMFSVGENAGFFKFLYHVSGWKDPIIKEIE